MTEASLAQIRTRCLDLLSRREHSQSELLNKLTAKGFDVVNCRTVIAEMVSTGWQSDQRFIVAFVRQRINKGFGPIRIDHELKQRGLDCSCSQLEIANLPDWATVIEAVYSKKYALDQNQLTPSEWVKRTRFLQQRGFSGEMIRKLFDQLELRF